MYNQSGDGYNDLLTRGGVPVSELFNSEIGGGGSTAGALGGKVVPIGLSVILRQPKRNTERRREYASEGHADVVSDEIFDRLFDSISPTAKKRRTTPTKRTRVLAKGTRKITKKPT